MAHTVSSECVACGACVDTCPVGAITMEDKAVEVTEDFRKQSDGSWLVSGSASFLR